MELDIVNHFLPKELLEHFTVVTIKELDDPDTDNNMIEFHLEEKNELPKGYLESDYESKGFTSESRVQDFPIRGKSVYLVIKRRRWRHKESKKEIRSDYSFIAEGSRLTQELSDFLKETGRYPRGYDE